MDWALFVILQLMFQPSLSDLFTVEAERSAYRSEFGGHVVMGCRFQPKALNPDAELMVTWHRLKPDRVVYQMKSGVGQPTSAEYNGRVKLLQEELRNGWAKLKLSNLRISDSGTYQCLVETAEGADYKTIALSVAAPYKSVTKYIQKTAEGQDVLLTCQSEGYPEASVAWRDGRLRGLKPNTTAVPTADQLFRVTSQIRVSARDKNNYTCAFTSDGRSATFQVPDEIPIPQLKKEALYITMSIAAVMAAIVVLLLVYRRRKKGSIALSARTLLGDGRCWPRPAAACLQKNKEDEEEITIINECGMEENLGVLLKARYSDFFGKATRRPWDVSIAEELPPRLQNNEGQAVKLEALLPEAGETLFLEGPPGSGKTTVAHILVSSWTEGSTDLLDLSTLRLLVYVDCSAAERDLFQEIISQLSLPNTWTEDALRTALTGSGEALLLLDGYREGKRRFDESLERLLSQRRRCRLLVLASPENCPALRDACGTGATLRLRTQAL